MFAPLIALLLTQSPAMAGMPVAAMGGKAIVIDFTQSLFASGVTGICANADITLDQGGAVSVTRASTAYCQKANGDLVTISANKPVVEADGLRIEPASTNVIPDTTNMGSWTPSGGADYNGAVTYFNKTNVGAQYTATTTGYWESASFTITGTDAAASLFASVDSGSQAFAFVLRDTTGSANVCTYTGTATTTWSTMKGRPSCTGTTTSGHTHVLRIYPGGLSGTTDGNGVNFYGPQVEARYSVTSFMESNGSTVSRSADAISATITDNTAHGCASANSTAVEAQFNADIFSTSNGNIIAMANHLVLFANDGTSVTFGNGVEMNNRTTVVRNSWSGSSLNLSADGNGVTGDFDGTIGGTTLFIGSDQGVNGFINGWVKGVKFSTDASGCTP